VRLFIAKGRMKPIIIAHRGASAYAPENTLAAFNLAFELGADGIELDVELTNDGVPVVFHSDPVKMTHGLISLKNMSLGEVKQLDAGAWFDIRYRGEKIPTLAEALSTMSPRGEVVIEIKWSAVRMANANLERAIAAVLAAAPGRNAWILSSFHPIALFRMRHLVPGIPRALIYQTKLVPAALNGPWFRSLVAPKALHVDTQMVDKNFVAWAHRNRYQIVAWHTEQTEEMRRLIALGVDGIMTNAPDVLRSVVDDNTILER
jgi:glycerophosphoryl diester phosphodiesterase